MAIEDITERKRIHEELLRSNEDLQRFFYMGLRLTLSRLLWHIIGVYSGAGVRAASRPSPKGPP